MNKKCCIKGCEIEVGFIEDSFGIMYCEECERLIMTAKTKKIDISLCKDKKDLIKLLKDKVKV